MGKRNLASAENDNRKRRLKEMKAMLAEKQAMLEVRCRGSAQQQRPHCTAHPNRIRLPPAPLCSTRTRALASQRRRWPASLDDYYSTEMD